jgi:hypothetical protein
MSKNAIRERQKKIWPHSSGRYYAFSSAQPGAMCGSASLNGTVSFGFSSGYASSSSNSEQKEIGK